MKQCYAIFVCLFLFVYGAFSQTSRIRGKVVSMNGEALPGATVFLPQTKNGTYANENGIFSFNVEVGTWEVIAMYLGFDTVRQVVEVQEGQTQTLRFALTEQSLYTEVVEITAEQSGKINKQQADLGKVEISQEEINLLPSFGAPDLAQYLQVVPGAVFSGDQGGKLFIRGGSPIQNLTMLDGMVIYSPFHSIGLFSVFDPAYIRSVDVYSAAFPAKYGGRISSVIDIKSRNPDFREWHVKANANPFSAGGIVEGPLKRAKRAGGGSSILLSARKNFIDQTSPSIYPYLQDSLGLPYNFLDLYGKLSFSDGANYANIFGFYQNDNANFEFPANTQWEASGGAANFQLLPSGAAAIISGNIAFSSYETGLNSSSEQFPRTSRISGFNGGIDLSYILRTVDEFSFGFNFLGFSTDYRFTNAFGLISEQSANNTEAAAYLRYKFVVQNPKEDSGLPESLAVLEPSIRIHYFNDQNHVAFEPRLRAKANLNRLSFNLGAGLYTQNLMAAVSDRDVVNLFQGFLSAPLSLDGSMKNHSLQTAWHVVAGIEAELFPRLSTRLEAWYKNFTQLSQVNRQRLFPSDPPFIVETGDAQGIDLSLKYRDKTWYAYATYGWSKVQREDGTQRYFPVWDRRHTANVIVAWQKGALAIGSKEKKWEFSMRWTLGSGFPFTRTQGYFEKLWFFPDGAQADIFRQNGSLGIILSDQLNDGRLPWYHRLDLSAKRRWTINNKMVLETNLSLLNVYDRDNIFYFDRIEAEVIYQLPFMPSLGLSISY